MINDQGDISIIAVCVTPVKHPRNPYKVEIRPIIAKNLNLFLAGVKKLLPLEYTDYADVFSKKNAIAFSKTIKVRHSILILKEAEVLYRPIYPLS